MEGNEIEISAIFFPLRSVRGNASIIATGAFSIDGLKDLSSLANNPNGHEDIDESVFARVESLKPSGVQKRVSHLTRSHA